MAAAKTTSDVKTRKKQLFDLNKNLNILLEREAKYGNNPPLTLLNQIDDHRQAIGLIEHALTGGLIGEELDEALEPLLLALRGGQVINIAAETYVAGDLIQNITHILSAAEEAAKAQELAARQLAEGVRDYLHRLQNVITAEPKTRGSPYKGLVAYHLSDADCFFGRDRAIAGLLTRLQRSPLTILHAESGAGKSSLLQAGIANRLLGQGDLPVYLRPCDQPNQPPRLAIKRAFLPGLTDEAELTKMPLRDFLHRVNETLGVQRTLYLLLDQFEEYFTVLKDAHRDEFVTDLAECLQDEPLNVRWILALRSEFFSNLAYFQPRIRNPFENEYRLNRLTLAEAKTVITAPVQQKNINLQSDLVEALLSDLGNPDSGEVAPPQLQLVCSTLYDALTQNNHETDRSTITLQMYTEKGRAEGILRNHLGRVLDRIPTPQARKITLQLLNALVSSDQRRIQRTRSELRALLNDPTAAQHLDDVLTQLVNDRLLTVHQDQQTDEHSYELVHDLLLAEIDSTPEIKAQKQAQELLEQEVEAFKRHGTLLDRKKFDIINDHRELLLLDADAQQLLRQSQTAIKADNEARRRTEIARISAEAGKRIRNAAIYGLFAGGIGFSLSYLTLFLPQVNPAIGFNYELLSYLTILRVLPGAVAGLFFVLLVNRANRANITKDYLVFLATGAGSAAFALLFHAYLKQFGLTDLLWVAMLGIFWGSSTGLIIRWSRDRAWWQAALLVALTGSLAFWLGNTVIPIDLFDDVPYAWLYLPAGALFPACLWGAMTLTKPAGNPIQTEIIENP